MLVFYKSFDLWLSICSADLFQSTLSLSMFWCTEFLDVFSGNVVLSMWSCFTKESRVIQAIQRKESRIQKHTILCHCRKVSCIWEIDLKRFDKRNVNRTAITMYLNSRNVCMYVKSIYNLVMTIDYPMYFNSRNVCMYV